MNISRLACLFTLVIVGGHICESKHGKSLWIPLWLFSVTFQIFIKLSDI